MMTNTQKSEATKTAANAFLAGTTYPVSETLQHILQCIHDSEDQYPAGADFLKEFLTCLCDQITPEQVFPEEDLD